MPVEETGIRYLEIITTEKKIGESTRIIVPFLIRSDYSKSLTVNQDLVENANSFVNIARKKSLIQEENSQRNPVVVDIVNAVVEKRILSQSAKDLQAINLEDTVSNQTIILEKKSSGLNLLDQRDLNTKHQIIGVNPSEIVTESMDYDLVEELNTPIIEKDFDVLNYEHFSNLNERIDEEWSNIDPLLSLESLIPTTKETISSTITTNSENTILKEKMCDGIDGIATINQNKFSTDFENMEMDINETLFFDETDRISYTRLGTQDYELYKEGENALTNAIDYNGNNSIQQYDIIFMEDEETEVQHNLSPLIQEYKNPLLSGCDVMEGYEKLHEISKIDSDNSVDPKQDLPTHNFAIYFDENSNNNNNNQNNREKLHLHIKREPLPSTSSTIQTPEIVKDIINLEEEHPNQKIMDSNITSVEFDYTRYSSMASISSIDSCSTSYVPSPSPSPAPSLSLALKQQKKRGRPSKISSASPDPEILKKLSPSEKKHYEQRCKNNYASRISRQKKKGKEEELEKELCELEIRNAELERMYTILCVKKSKLKDLLFN